MEAVLRVQLTLSCALHVNHRKKPLQDLQNLHSTTMERSRVGFRGVREKDTMLFVECPEVSQEDTIESPPWGETIGKSLGSHDAARLVGGMCYGNGCWQETTRLDAIFCTKTGWSSLPLRKSKVRFVVEDKWPSERELVDKSGRLNPSRNGHNNGRGSTRRQPPATQE